MARIDASNDYSVLKIRSFLGLNENPDGETTLKNGEMSEMRNFRITQDQHMQIRPGTKTIMDLAQIAAESGEVIDPSITATRLHGVWNGVVGGREHTLVAFAGGLWDVDILQNTARKCGIFVEGSHDVSFFGFDEKVYMLDGDNYKSWDGGAETSFTDVEGYIPLVQTATTPAGIGTLLENVNRLNGKRRVQFSPDGTATTFQLPERKIVSVLSVEVNGAAVGIASTDTEAGKFTLASAPVAGTNTMMVTYQKDTGKREDVTHMRYSELFNGSTDARVFLYGDGTNRAIYSGIDYDTGKPSAEYFPDLYEIAVGEANTPLTGLIRHFSKMLAFKTNSTWVVQHSTITLPNGNVNTAFYVQPVNRQLGNEALGQVKLVENNPLTLDNGSIYQWENRVYSGYSSGSESSAKRVSGRVERTLRSFDMANIRTFNIKGTNEFWFSDGDRALILNYSNNTWYLYTELPFEQIVEFRQELYGFGRDGKVYHFSRRYRNDDGANIVCYAATGAMDFGKDWLQKYSPMIFVAMQPETGARVNVTVETNRRSRYPEKLVEYGLITFLHMDFNHFSFGTNRRPQVRRVKIKVKKATFYRLIYKSDSPTATATILETDVKLRYAGAVK